MKNSKTFWVYLIIALILGFAGGAWLAPGHRQEDRSRRPSSRLILKKPRRRSR